MKHHFKQWHSINRTHLLHSINEEIFTVTRSDCHDYVEHTRQFYEASLDRMEIYNDDTENKSDETAETNTEHEELQSFYYTAYT